MLTDAVHDEQLVSTKYWSCRCLFLQAYGGGGGATSVDFDLKGQAWEWGDYGLDQVRGGEPHPDFAISLP